MPKRLDRLASLERDPREVVRGARDREADWESQKDGPSQNGRNQNPSRYGMVMVTKEYESNPNKILL
jgi:hypothetical protein